MKKAPVRLRIVFLLLERFRSRELLFLNFDYYESNRPSVSGASASSFSARFQAFAVGFLSKWIEIFICFTGRVAERGS